MAQFFSQPIQHLYCPRAAENMCDVSPVTQPWGLLSLVDSEYLTLAQNLLLIHH
jgi:hypothetical protein